MHAADARGRLARGWLRLRQEKAAKGMFTASLLDANHTSAAVPGLRCACPGLLSSCPSGTGTCGAAIAWTHCMERTLAGGSQHCMQRTLAGGSHWLRLSLVPRCEGPGAPACSRRSREARSEVRRCPVFWRSKLCRLTEMFPGSGGQRRVRVRGDAVPFLLLASASQPRRWDAVAAWSCSAPYSFSSSSSSSSSVFSSLSSSSSGS